MKKSIPRDEILNESDGEQLDRIAGAFNTSRDAVLKVIEIVGANQDDVKRYLEEWGAPGTAP